MTELLEWLKANAPDCGDNSCVFGGRGKGGMRTNGGCRCFKDLPGPKRIYVERLFSALRPEGLRSEPTAWAVFATDTDEMLSVEIVEPEKAADEYIEPLYMKLPEPQDESK